MRSLLSALLLISSLAACGTEFSPQITVPDCGNLGYENFGAPFVLNWCRGCHSSALSEDMRQDAPLDVNFDDLDHIQAWAPQIAMRVAGPSPTMPPASGPSDEERQMMAEWIECGAHD